MFDPPARSPQLRRRGFTDASETQIELIVEEGRAAQRKRTEIEEAIRGLRSELDQHRYLVGRACRALHEIGYSRRQVAEMIGNENPQRDEGYGVPES